MHLQLQQTSRDSIISFRSDADARQSLAIKVVREGLQVWIENLDVSEMLPIIANVSDGKWHQINLR